MKTQKAKTQMKTNNPPQLKKQGKNTFAYTVHVKKTAHIFFFFLIGKRTNSSFKDFSQDLLFARFYSVKRDPQNAYPQKILSYIPA